MLTNYVMPHRPVQPTAREVGVDPLEWARIEFLDLTWEAEILGYLIALADRGEAQASWTGWMVSDLAREELQARGWA